MYNVFIIGSKGIPAAYGGFETFVEKLTEYKKSGDIKYHVACRSCDCNKVFEHNGARCFNVCVPRCLKAAGAVYYDIAAIRDAIHYIKKNGIRNATVYVLACRIGPFIGRYRRKLHKLGARLIVNPDGHEWKRAKWNWLIRKYWKLSEALMVKNADLLICDSKNIEAYIQKDYARYSPKTTFIAYGAELSRSTLANDDRKYTDWLLEKGLKAKEYYLVVGRFVPENNVETIIREFMVSKTRKSLALVTNANDYFLESLKKRIGFDRDPRIKFVGTVYDQELLKKIREGAYGYFHGHSVGGTNPSLLEALSSTALNLLLDVSFNREVAEDSALYWTKDPGNLAELIEKVDALSSEEIGKYAVAALQRIITSYSWDKIVSDYEKIFLGNG
jgi:rhamnosyltransferase